MFVNQIFLNGKLNFEKVFILNLNFILLNYFFGENSKSTFNEIKNRIESIFMKISLKKIAIVFILLSSTLLFNSLNVPGIVKISNKPQNNQALPVIHFSTGAQTTNTLANMVADFNANYSASYGFTVQLDESTFSQLSQHDTYVSAFQKQSTSYDVISMDVIWPSEFASHGYILPMNDVFNGSYQNQFIQAAIEAGTYMGSIYGVPWFHDSGMLYYRSDILQYAVTNNIITDPGAAPPKTWAQLHDWSISMMSNTALIQKFNLTAGFVWQASSYEGLMCDFMEYIGGTETYSFLNATGNGPIFNTSPGIRDALTYMRSLIADTASPNQVLTFAEENSRAVWNAGSAIFMRNWPYAYKLSLDSSQLNGSLVTGTNHNIQQFNVTTMPYQNSSVVNPLTSCLGGWQLGVSAYSTHPADAKKFIMWVTSYKEQLAYFLGDGDTPTLKAVFNDPLVVNSPQGYVHQFLPVFESSLPRPVSPIYPQMSGKISPTINNYLGGGITIDIALNKLQTDTQSIIAANPPTTTTPTTTTPSTNLTTTNSNTSTFTTTISVSTPSFEYMAVIGLLLIVSSIFKRKVRKGEK